MQETNQVPTSRFWRMIAGGAVLVVIYRLPDIIGAVAELVR